MVTQHHPGCPEPPDRLCGAGAGPESPEPKHFARSRRSRRDILIGAGDGMLSWVGDRSRSRAKISRIQVFGDEARAIGARPCSRRRSWSRSRRDIKLGARAGAIAGMLSLSRSRSRSKLSRLRTPASGDAVPLLRLRVLLITDPLPAARRPPGQSVLSGAASTVSQARRTHKDDRGISQWIPSSGVPSIRAFRVFPVPWICYTHAIT